MSGLSLVCTCLRTCNIRIAGLYFVCYFVFHFLQFQVNKLMSFYDIPMVNNENENISLKSWLMMTVLMEQEAHSYTYWGPFTYEQRKISIDIVFYLVIECDNVILYFRNSFPPVLSCATLASGPVTGPRCLTLLVLTWHLIQEVPCVKCSSSTSGPTWNSLNPLVQQLQRYGA